MAIRDDRIAADLAAIAAITQTPGNGATRPTFSAEWGRARDHVIAEAAKISCTTRIDASGNTFITQTAIATPTAARSDRDAEVPTWLCGSHLDTVPHGGDYDGVAGVVVALELLRSAHEDGITLPLTLVVFAEEEGPTFGLGMLGSRALVGELTAEQLGALKNAEGQTYLEAGAPFGVVAAEIAASRLRTENYLGLIELHIEQGPGMWRRDQCLAVVTAIAGRRQYRGTVLGEANHAGATAMSDRRDALLTAADAVRVLAALAVELSPQTVMTVGRMTVHPNAVNVIADRVDFTADFRAPDDATLIRGDSQIYRRLRPIFCRRTRFEFVETERIAARPMSSALVEAVGRSASLVGLGDVPKTVSGALHDSAVLAPHLPTVMLFVPSRDGISHNPAEFSRVEDIANGARVIEHLVRRPTLAMLNAMPRDAFVAAVGHAYEHSPWIAERAADARPFASLEALAAAMSDVVGHSSRDEQLALIRAHPDLVGKLAREGRVTRESTAEQAAAGLAALSDEEIAAFERYNAAYRDRFGFPFVICARANKKAAILAAFPTRLANDVEAEIATALAEIDKIAALRLADAVWDEKGHR